MGKSKSYLPFSLPRVLIISGCISLLFFKYSSEHPKPEWDTSPNAIVISYEVGIREIEYGYIPDFRVWGDGRIVWVEHHFDYTRTVFEGYLSQDKLKELIEKFVDAGYFNWFGGGGTSYDYMRIKLVDKDVIRLLDANQEISELVAYLESGAGVEPKEFIPVIGYLYVYPIEETEYKNMNITVEYEWDEDKYGFNLEEIYSVIPDGELTGEKLDFVWQVVNNSSFIESDGEIYWIGLEIPNITY